MQVDTLAGVMLYIDGIHKPTIASFINHSCEPNLKSWFPYFVVDGDAHLLPLFVAMRDIQATEFLSISYGKDFFVDVCSFFMFIYLSHVHAAV
jgi:SET domain-containing protein